MKKQVSDMIDVANEYKKELDEYKRREQILWETLDDCLAYVSDDCLSCQAVEEIARKGMNQVEQIAEAEGDSND